MSERKYRVYDERGDITLLETDDQAEAMLFMMQFDEDHPSFDYVWLEKKMVGIIENE